MFFHDVVGGQLGNQLRRVVDRTGEGVLADFGVADGEFVTIIIVQHVDALDARAPLGILEGRMLEVETHIDEAHGDALARVGGGSCGQCGAVELGHARFLSCHVGLQLALVADVDTLHALDALQCLHVVGGHAHHHLAAQAGAHLGSGGFHLVDRGRHSAFVDAHHQCYALQLLGPGGLSFLHAFHLGFLFH